MECDKDMMLDHEQRITQATNKAESAHNRIDSMMELVKDFTIEMRESNKNINNMVNQVSILTEQIKHIVSATKKHEEDIEDIKDNMETKDTVLNLYKKIEESNARYERGMDSIMDKLRHNENSLDEHIQEPAKTALENQKALKRWFVVGFGSIILSVATATILFFIFK